MTIPPKVQAYPRVQPSAKFWARRGNTAARSATLIMQLFLALNAGFVEFLAAVILELVVPSLGELGNFQNLGAHHAILGDSPAIAMIGIYREPEIGRVFLRVAGVLAPSGSHALISITHTIHSVVPEKKHQRHAQNLCRHHVGVFTVCCRT